MKSVASEFRHILRSRPARYMKDWYKCSRQNDRIFVDKYFVHFCLDPIRDQLWDNHGICLADIVSRDGSFPPYPSAYIMEAYGGYPREDGPMLTWTNYYNDSGCFVPYPDLRFGLRPTFRGQDKTTVLSDLGREEKTVDEVVNRVRRWALEDVAKTNLSILLL